MDWLGWGGGGDCNYIFFSFPNLGDGQYKCCQKGHVEQLCE